MSRTTHDVAAWIDTMTGLATPPRTVAAVAVAAVEAAGQGGGVDEVARLARDGWPSSRPLDLGGVAEEDESALRAAIQYAAGGPSRR